MKKKFDAVKFQREVREKLSEKYSSDRKSFLSELKEKYAYEKRKLARTSNDKQNETHKTFNKI